MLCRAINSWSMTKLTALGWLRSFAGVVVQIHELMLHESLADNIIGISGHQRRLVEHPLLKNLANLLDFNHVLAITAKAAFCGEIASIKRSTCCTSVHVFVFSQRSTSQSQQTTAEFALKAISVLPAKGLLHSKNRPCGKQRDTQFVTMQQTELSHLQSLF